MPKMKQAVTFESANRHRQSVDYAMKHAMNKAREGNSKMLEILHNDAKASFEMYFDMLHAIAGNE